jgi:hypothetical protein
MSGEALQPRYHRRRQRSPPLFLCPRCRARLCNGCHLAGLMTCAFAACCVNLPESGSETAPIGPPLFHQVPDQLLSARRPRRKTLFTETSVPALKRRPSVSAVTSRLPARSRQTRAWSVRRSRRTRRTATRSCRRLLGAPKLWIRFSLDLITTRIVRPGDVPGRARPGLIFLCPRFRAEHCDGEPNYGNPPMKRFLYPWCRAQHCDRKATRPCPCRDSGFYALGFGRGFATDARFRHVRPGSFRGFASHVSISSSSAIPYFYAI